MKRSGIIREVGAIEIGAGSTYELDGEHTYPTLHKAIIGAARSGSCINVQFLDGTTAIYTASLKYVTTRFR